MEILSIRRWIYCVSGRLREKANIQLTETFKLNYFHSIWRIDAYCTFVVESHACYTTLIRTHWFPFPEKQTLNSRTHTHTLTQPRVNKILKCEFQFHTESRLVRQITAKWYTRTYMVTDSNYVVGWECVGWRCALKWIQDIVRVWILSEYVDSVRPQINV